MARSSDPPSFVEIFQRIQRNDIIRLILPIVFSGSTRSTAVVIRSRQFLVQLSEFISEIEKALGRKAKKNYMDMQPGDVPATYADIDDLAKDVGFKPATPLSVGIKKFIDWYKDYHSIV